jgi:hypothetical protein
MEEIKKFLNNLPLKSHNSNNYDDVVSLSINKTPEHLPFDMVNITIKNNFYIANVLIPYFDSMF